MSPAAKKRAKSKLTLTTEAQVVRSKLMLEKVIVGVKERSSIVAKVERFMLNNLNSVAVPNMKIKAGTRYRSASLELLHLKYLSECESVDEETSSK